jgi:hypothetical protein
VSSGRRRGAEHDARDLGEEGRPVGPTVDELGHGREHDVARGVLRWVEPDVVMDGRVQPRKQDPRGLVMLVYVF